MYLSHPAFPVPSLRASSRLRRAGATRAAAAASSWLPDGGFSGLPGAADFVALLDAYRATGGTCNADEFVHRLKARQCGNFWTLARLIVGGGVVSIEWNGSFWLPLFQFDPQQLSVRPGVQRVLDELGPGLDSRAVAEWFARPAPDLGQRRPAELCTSKLPAVLRAARAARCHCAAGSGAPPGR